MAQPQQLEHEARALFSLWSRLLKIRGVASVHLVLTRRDRTIQGRGAISTATTAAANAHHRLETAVLREGCKG